MLLIETKDHRIIEGPQAIHSLLCEEEGVDPEDVIAVGFRMGGEDRVVWDKRAPYVSGMK